LMGRGERTRIVGYGPDTTSQNFEMIGSLPDRAALQFWPGYRNFRQMPVGADSERLAHCLGSRRIIALGISVPPSPFLWPTRTELLIVFEGKRPPMHDHPHHENELDEMTARVRALETILVEKGLVDPAAVDAIIETYEYKVGPRNGAAVVARAWSDPEFADWLKEDATAAIASMGFVGRQGEHMVAVFNNPEEHNLVVCTLCSCYPWPVLGLPPTWYKAPAYRSRAVREPRAVLEEFGVTLPETTRIRVWDSTAEVRYLVIPERPEGTDGLDADALVELVTRDSMIGCGQPRVPGST
jgi:nitrile hydratase